MADRVYPYNKDDPYMTLDDAIEYVMKAQGKTRRQAKAAIYEAARQGKLRAAGQRDGSDEFVDIPKEAWPKIN